jgi:hypothetical protein
MKSLVGILVHKYFAFVISVMGTTGFFCFDWRGEQR